MTTPAGAGTTLRNACLRHPPCSSHQLLLVGSWFPWLLAPALRFGPSRSPQSVGKDCSVLRGLWRLQTFVCVRGVSAIMHIYPSVLQALAGQSRTGRLEGGLQGYRGEAMQDLGYELRRIL